MSDVTIPLKGTSMWPLIRSGDNVLVKDETDPELIIGEVYLLRDMQTKEMYIHRYLGQNVFKGDNNHLLDDDSFSLIGRVTELKSHKKTLKMHRIPKFIKNLSCLFSREYHSENQRSWKIIARFSLWIINFLTKYYYSENYPTNDLSKTT